jgi:hypothetical protein
MGRPSYIEKATDGLQFCSTRPQTRQIAALWTASATDVVGAACAGVSRADECAGFPREARGEAELAPWTRGRRRWLFRPCRGLAARNRALARRMGTLRGGADLAGGPYGQVPRPGGGPVWRSAQTEPPKSPSPLGTTTTTPECVQDYMIAWHARLGPILCPCAMTRSWGPCTGT